MSWVAFGGSMTGSTHLRHGEPNEDAWAVSGRGDRAAAAVADGHGSPRCPRAARGARFAVDIATAMVVTADVAAGADDLDRWLRDDVCARVVAAWRARVRADARSRPLGAAETEAIGGRGDDEILSAYGCTLVAVVATPTALAVLQVGDGDAVLVHRDGRTTSPVPLDPNAVAGATSSLAQRDPCRAARTAAAATTDVALAWVSTDGFGSAFAEPTWRDEVGRDLLDRVTSLPLAELSDRVPQWLEEPARIAGDDATMAVLARRSLVAR
jgi:hypothetical protein